MIANCSSHSGLQSTFAPESRRTVGPLSAGQTVAIAGREIPSIVRSLMSAIARNAPLFPAETTASASPCLTRSTATPSEVRSQERAATEGERSIATASGAWITRMRSAPFPRRSGRTRASSPTSTTSASNSSAAKHGAGYDLAGSVVASHRVDGDARAAHGGSFWCGPPRNPCLDVNFSADARGLPGVGARGTIPRLWRSGAKFAAKARRRATTSATR